MPQNRLMDLLPYDPGLGPMTPRTIGGRPNAILSQGDLTPPPTTLETMLGYGSLPARAWTGQLHTAADAAQRAYNEPSIANVTNAGLQTGIAAGSPLVAAGSLALGYGAAGASDAIGSIVSPAAADPSRIAAIDADLARLSKQRDDQMRRMGQGSTNARNRAERAVQGLNAQIGTLTEERRALSEAQATGQAREREERAKVEAETRRRFSEQEAAAFGRANAAAARDDRFSDSSLNDVYQTTGGNVPLAFAAAMMPGFINRTAGLGKNFFRDAAEGTAAAFSVNSAPDAYDMIMAPTLNPEYERASILARELPEGHDQRAMYEEQERMMREGGLIENPVKATARDNFFDPEILLKRAGISALEGLAGPLGYNIPGALSRTAQGAVAAPGYVIGKMAEIPGQISAGYARGQNAAQAARNAAPGPVPPNTPGGGGSPPPGGGPGGRGAPPGGGRGQTQNQRGRNQGPSAQTPQGKRDEQIDTLEAIIQGQQLTPRQQTIAAYLTRQAQDLGTTPDKMLAAMRSRSKVGRFAVPLAIGVGGAAALMQPGEAQAAPSFEQLLEEYAGLVRDMDGDGDIDADDVMLMMAQGAR